MNFLGVPIVGSLTFNAQVDAVVDIANKVVITPAPITVTLDTHGKLDITIPATDDPDITPSAFTYQVKENWNGGRTYSIQAPQNGIINLASVVPVPSASGTVNYFVTPTQYNGLIAAVSGGSGGTVTLIDGGAHA